jgi:UDP-N-acetylmuramate dehydrogenase
MLKVNENVSLAPFTTLGVGGRARYVIIVTTTEELQEAVQYARQRSLPFFVFGGGSNVLVVDQGYDGVVIVMRMLGRTNTRAGSMQYVTAAAGEQFDDVIAWTVQEGWWGLENLSHIPGTVGATPVQNVGAYGVEVADHVSTVTVFDTRECIERVLTRDECLFSYRDSIFKQQPGRYIITFVTFVLSTESCPRITYKDLAHWFGDETIKVTQQSIRDAVISIRSRKFPDWHIEGTAGSFFKNPIVSEEYATRLQQQYPELPLYPAVDGNIKISLGYVLDKICHRKGYMRNGVRLYEEQALVLVTSKNNTATAVAQFAEEIKKVVFEKIGLAIEEEVTTLR